MRPRAACFLMLLVLALAGCGRVQTTTEDQCRNDTRCAYERVLRDHLKDGASARLRHVSLRQEFDRWTQFNTPIGWRTQRPRVAMCGEVNAKNIYGRDTGFVPFVVTPDRSVFVAVDDWRPPPGLGIGTAASGDAIPEQKFVDLYCAPAPSSRKEVAP